LKQTLLPPVYFFTVVTNVNSLTKSTPMNDQQLIFLHKQKTAL